MILTLWNGQKDNHRNEIFHGDQARDSQHWTKAVHHYEEHLKKEPYNFDILVQLGNCAKEAGLYEKSLTAYRRAMEVNSENADLFLQIGHLCKITGSIREAGESYLNAYYLDKNNGDVALELKNMGLSYILISGKNKTSANRRVIGDKDICSLTEEFYSQYEATFTDVKELLKLGLISSSRQHFQHYGYQQGRATLLTQSPPPTRAILVCPSYGKRCGIGEHTRYLAQSLERSGLSTMCLRTTDEARSLSANILKDAVVIVNHGPGLFDGYNPQLSEGESTTEMLANLMFIAAQREARPLIFMHSLVDVDNKDMFARQQLILNSPIPTATTVAAAARMFNIPWVEHGLQPINTFVGQSSRNNTRPVVGFFGFFHYGGKNFDALFELVEKIGAKLVGAVAGSDHDIKKLKKLLKRRDIEWDLGTGWVSDDELAKRLQEADFYYLPQYDYDHWNNSGTARFVMNLGKPVLLPPHNPFLDLREWALFVDDHDLPAVTAYLRTSDAYRSASQRSAAYAANHPMSKEMVALATNLLGIQIAQGASQMINDGWFSAVELLNVNSAVFDSRVAFRTDRNISVEETAPNSSRRMEQLTKIRHDHPGKFELTYSPVREIEYWKSHYEIHEFIRPSLYAVFLNAYRSILKREPCLPDEIFVSRLLKQDVHNLNKRPNGDQICTILNFLMAQDNCLPLNSSIQLYSEGIPISQEQICSKEMSDKLNWLYTKQVTSASTLKSSYRGFGDINDYNLFSILLLPPNLSAEAVCRITSYRKEALESAFEKDECPQNRFKIVVDRFSREGISVSKTFLLDRPIVGRLMPARTVYSVADFWPLFGKDFLFFTFKTLLKRKPSVLEIDAAKKLLTHGKHHVLSFVQALPEANAIIGDIESADFDRYEWMVERSAVLFDRFRSPTSGGWNLRNRYLEEKRNHSRDLLKYKNERRSGHYEL